MSDETKTPRTLAEINAEYTALCANYGDKQFRIQRLEADCKALSQALNKVENEAREAQKAAAEAAQSNVTPINNESQAV